MIRRYWPRTAGHRHIRHRRAAVLKVCSVLFLIVLCARLADRLIMPQLAVLATAEVRQEITRISTEAVLEELAHCPDAGQISERDSEAGGGVILSAEPSALNQLRLHVVKQVNEQTSSLDENQLGVALGTLTGLQLLSEIGPRLPIRVLSVASVDAAFQSEFQSAGINQTLYRSVLNVTVQARILLPGKILPIQVSTPVCLSEVIVIGNVPEVYPYYQK